MQDLNHILARLAELETLVQRIPLLEAQLAQSTARCATLEAENNDLRQKVADLEARLKQNLQNSSKPPSTDVSHKGRIRNPANVPKKPGAQPGHKGTRRTWFPPEKVTQTLSCWPATCSACYAELPQHVVGNPDRQQHIELPKIQPVVTEFHLFRVACPHCQTLTRGQPPTQTQTGPRLTTLVAWLVGKAYLSRKSVSDLLDQVLGIPLYTGSVQAACVQNSDALAAPVSALTATLPAKGGLSGRNGVAGGQTAVVVGGGHENIFGVPTARKPWPEGVAYMVSRGLSGGGVFGSMGSVRAVSDAAGLLGASAAESARGDRGKRPRAGSSSNHVQNLPLYLNRR